MSDNGESRKRESRMLLLLAIFGFYIIALTSACGPSLANPIRNPESGLEKICITDLECDEGSFCFTKFGQGKCTICSDCAKWQRLPPLGRICAKTREDCGDCRPGFEDGGSGRCLQKKEELTTFTNSTKNEVPVASSTKWTIFLCVASVLSIVFVVSVVGYRHRAKRSGPEEFELKEPIAPSAPEYGRPPSQNPDYRVPLIEKHLSQPCPRSSGYKLVDEKHQTATPFSPGNSYGETTQSFFDENPEQQQFDPNNDLNNLVQNENEDQVVAVAAAAPFIPPPPPQAMEIDLFEEMHQMMDSAVDIPDDHLNEESINLEEAERDVRSPENPHQPEQGNLDNQEENDDPEGFLLEFQAQFRLVANIALARYPRYMSDLDLNLPVLPQSLNDSGFTSLSNINSPRPSLNESEILTAVAERVPPILPVDEAPTTTTTTTTTDNDHCVPEAQSQSTSQVLSSRRFFVPPPQRRMNFVSPASRSIRRARLHGRMRPLEATTNGLVPHFGETEERMEL